MFPFQGWYYCLKWYYCRRDVFVWLHEEQQLDTNEKVIRRLVSPQSNWWWINNSDDFHPRRFFSGLFFNEVGSWVRSVAKAPSRCPNFGDIWPQASIRYWLWKDLKRLGSSTAADSTAKASVKEHEVSWHCGNDSASCNAASRSRCIQNCPGNDATTHFRPFSWLREIWPIIVEWYVWSHCP
jgi:hypothetical protein